MENKTSHKRRLQFVEGRGEMSPLNNYYKGDVYILLAHELAWGEAYYTVHHLHSRLRLRDPCHYFLASGKYTCTKNHLNRREMHET